MSQYVSQIMRKEDSEILPIEDLNLRGYKFFVIKWEISNSSYSGEGYSISCGNRTLESGTLPSSGFKSGVAYVSGFNTDVTISVNGGHTKTINTGNYYGIFEVTLN